METLEEARPCDGCGRQTCDDFDLCDVTHTPTIGPRRCTSEQWAEEWEWLYGTPARALREDPSVRDVIADFTLGVNLVERKTSGRGATDHDRSAKKAIEAVLALGLSLEDAGDLFGAHPLDLAVELKDRQRNNPEGVVIATRLLAQPFSSTAAVAAASGLHPASVGRLIELMGVRSTAGRGPGRGQHTAEVIGEVIRRRQQAVPQTQVEIGKALGLSKGQVNSIIRRHQATTKENAA